MQIQRVQNNNNPNFGVKLVLREGMFPHKTWDKPDVKELKRLVTTVETKTADKEGTMYVPGGWKDWDDSRFTEHMNVYFNNGSYNDGVTLYDVHKQDLRNNTDKLIDTFVNLADVFKMRESAVKTTQLLRDRISELQSEVDCTFENIGKNVDKTLKSFNKKYFANEVLDKESGLEPNGMDFKSLSKSFAEDEAKQNKILNVKG